MFPHRTRLTLQKRCSQWQYPSRRHYSPNYPVEELDNYREKLKSLELPFGFLFVLANWNLNKKFSRKLWFQNWHKLSQPVNFQNMKYQMQNDNKKHIKRRKQMTGIVLSSDVVFGQNGKSYLCEWRYKLLLPHGVWVLQSHWGLYLVDVASRLVPVRLQHPWLPHCERGRIQVAEGTQVQVSRIARAEDRF